VQLQQLTSAETYRGPKIYFPQPDSKILITDLEDSPDSKILVTDLGDGDEAVQLPRSALQQGTISQVEDGVTIIKSFWEIELAKFF
jgi:hypothetical protein